VHSTEFKIKKLETSLYRVVQTCFDRNHLGVDHECDRQTDGLTEIEIEQGLTSHQTHYRSHRGRFLQVIWPNQQCQTTEGNQLVLQIRP